MIAMDESTYNQVPPSKNRLTKNSIFIGGESYQEQLSKMKEIVKVFDQKGKTKGGEN